MICHDVEFLNLKSIENHIRLKDPEKHKTKLLELLDKGEKNSEYKIIKKLQHLFCVFIVGR
jgi:hypothetical protein